MLCHGPVISTTKRTDYRHVIEVLKKMDQHLKHEGINFIPDILRREDLSIVRSLKQQIEKRQPISCLNFMLQKEASK